MADNPDEFQVEEGKFNAAVETLMKISAILSKIETVSTEYVLFTNMSGIALTAGQAQHTKHRLVKMLLLRAAPLMKSVERTEEIYKDILGIKLKVNNKVDNLTGNISSVVEEFDPEIDVKLDIIILKIEAELQKGKHFMPDKSKNKMF